MRQFQPPRDESLDDMVFALRPRTEPIFLCDKGDILIVKPHGQESIQLTKETGATLKEALEKWLK